MADLPVSLQYASRQAFVKGLDDIITRPLLTLEQEFTRDYAWTDYKGASYTLREEWEYVNGPAVPATDKTPGTRDKDNGGVTLQQFCDRINDHIAKRREELKAADPYAPMPSEANAFLTREEVLAVRLYSGPAYQVVNHFLRAIGSMSAYTTAFSYATPRPRRGSAFIDHYPPLGRFPPHACDAPGGNVHGHGVAPLPRDPQALRHHARGGELSAVPWRARRALPETVRGERAEQPPFTGLACQQASCRTPSGCGASSAWSVPPTPRSCPPRATAPRQCITWTRPEPSWSVEPLGCERRLFTLLFCGQAGPNVLWSLRPSRETDTGFHYGADISLLSQFAAEQEVLFPPCTMLQVVGRRSGDAAEMQPRCKPRD